MSAQRVDDLKTLAKHEKDPSELRRLANLLQQQGAWDEAAKARNKAHQIERQQAEAVAR